MKKLILSLLFFVAVQTPVFSQGVTVSGKVTDSGSEPLPGVTVTVAGSTVRTSTDAAGNYSILVPSEGATLVFTYIGFVPKTIPTRGQSTINVQLETDSRQLDELVVVGYGTVRKSDLTGSVSQVKGAEINAFPSSSLVQTLSGRASGVQVKQNTGAPGAPASIRIRGTNSIQGSNEPLYVVDGFPMGSAPALLNNSDIESIEILKDASATAIYGSRGANGVILVTTKKGKAGRTTVDIESTFSIQQLRKKLELMNATEYATFYNRVAANDNFPARFTQAEIDAAGEGFDWQDFTFRNAPMQNHNITIGGGNEKTKFSVGGSVFNQDGIIKSSGYDRYSVRASIAHTLSDKFSVDYNVTLSRLRRDDQPSNGGDRGNSLISGTVAAYPTVTPFNPDGSYRILSTAYSWGSNSIVSPINYLNETTNITRSNRILANASVAYKPIPELAIRIMGGIENADDRFDGYTTLKYLASPGRASVSSDESLSLLNENTITYSKSFNKHSLTAVGGFTFQNFTNTSISGSGTGFLTDVTESYNLGAAETPGIPQSDYSLSAVTSYLSRVNYGFNNKYLLTLSMRADGSSRYTEGNKWGYFPSGALAWRISEEEFIKNAEWISDLKLRTGWGRTGSQAISPYTTLNQLTSGKTVFGDALYTTFAPGTRLPGDLRWETTETLDFGIDAGIFNNRLRLTGDYYIKNTTDLLNTVSLPSSLGFTNTIQNIGSIRNQGFELSVDANVFNKSFQWDVSGNIAFNKNTVTKLYGGKDVLGSSYNITLVNDVVNILREGEPLGAFFGYTENGYDANGKIQYVDTNNDGLINSFDKTIIGDPNPDFIFGLSSS
ncbi:MAG TPA: TonB-dependent receptor, partial [Sphingobacteriaceae bacterium]